MWQQTYGWISAFANYVISAALALFLILMMEKSIKSRSKKLYFLLPLAVAVSLFTENLTVYAFCAFFMFSLICFIKTRRVNPFHIAMTTDSALGGIIMFSNDLYAALLQNGTALDGIRSLAFDVNAGFGEIAAGWAERYFCGILPQLVFTYRWLSVVLLLMLILGAAVRKKTPAMPRLFIVSAVFAAVICIYPFLGYENRTLNGVLAVAFLLAVSLMISSGFEKRGKMLFLWLSAPGVLLPLIITTEIGPRLYYLPYILVAAVAVTALPGHVSKKTSGLISGILALSLVGCMVFYGRIYVEIRSVTVARQNAINYAVENNLDSVIMEEDKNKYWWGRNPTADVRVDFFKEFYGIPEDMEVIFE